MRNRPRSPFRPIFARLVARLRPAFWNERGLKLLRTELAQAPAAASAAAAQVGMRTGAAAFYRLPRWLMVPLLSLAWLAIAKKRA